MTPFLPHTPCEPFLARAIAHILAQRASTPSPVAHRPGNDGSVLRGYPPARIFNINQYSRTLARTFLQVLAGFTADGDATNFARRRRQTGVRHGRIFMLATMGYITPELGSVHGLAAPRLRERARRARAG